MRSRAEYERVAELLRAGLNDCQVSRATGIPRGTVKQWRHNGCPGRYVNGGDRRACPVCETGHLDPEAFAYLLGLYLGDGYIVMIRTTWCLRIVQDLRYVGLIDECAAAIRAVSGRKVCVVKKQGCVAVTASWKHWTCLFPQHGPGRKHLRKIELAGWQREIVAHHPERLLAGLIHSDGCRVMNPVYGRHYPRYEFKNHSADIQKIFTNACDAYGISWTQSKWNTISIARARDVAKLDLAIDAKR